MRYAFRAAIASLLLLGLPAAHAADSGWLESPQNTHAKVRFQAKPGDAVNNETQLLLSVSLEKGWKTYWRSPGEGALRPKSPGKMARQKRNGFGRRLRDLTSRASPLRAITMR